MILDPSRTDFSPYLENFYRRQTLSQVFYLKEQSQVVLLLPTYSKRSYPTSSQHNDPPSYCPTKEYCDSLNLLLPHVSCTWRMVADCFLRCLRPNAHGLNSELVQQRAVVPSPLLPRGGNLLQESDVLHRETSPDVHTARRLSHRSLGSWLSEGWRGHDCRGGLRFDRWWGVCQSKF